jgi:hypothetical protein
MYSLAYSAPFFPGATAAEARQRYTSVLAGKELPEGLRLAGPYGNRRYPGNCSGELIKDLLRYFRPKRVLDPMTGSGTCADVCREIGIECVSFDIREGRDAADPQSYLGLGEFDFIWIHPPYWRQKLYTDDPRDLSTAARTNSSSGTGCCWPA